MSTLQHFGKGVVRVAKNYTKGYSDVQAKVRDATSNDPWGPSGTQMNELAQLTYNQYVVSFHPAHCTHWPQE
jgi:epsin